MGLTWVSLQSHAWKLLHFITIFFAIDISVLTLLKVWVLVFHYLHFTPVDIDVLSFVRRLIIFACSVIISWDRTRFITCDSTILILVLMTLILWSKDLFLLQCCAHVFREARGEWRKDNDHLWLCFCCGWWKKGTAGLDKVRFSNRSFTFMSDRQARLQKKKK